MNTEELRALWDRRESKMNGDDFAGLEYDTELAGPGGVCVALFVPGNLTARAKAKQILEAKDAARWITQNHCARRVMPETGELVPENKKGGILLDAFSASAMVQVYDALNETDREKLNGMDVRVAHKIVFQLLSKQRT